MADTKVTALTENTTPVSTDLSLIIDDPAGTAASQKITLANLMALFANPVSDDGDGLGTSALRWADLFLASGGVINFNNGNVTLTHGAASITIAGGKLELAAGTTSIVPLKFTAGTNLTTAESGGIEFDGNCFYGCSDAGNRGYIPVRHFIRCDSTRTLPNDTNENAIFSSPANGRITLETGLYKFEALMQVTSMSATSGNALIDWLGAGTATCAAWMWQYLALDNSAPTTGATNQGAVRVTQDSAASIATAGTGTGLNVWATGTFEVTGAGTMIPSIDQVTAAAAVVGIGSYFMLERIGSTTVVSVGQWD